MILYILLIIIWLGFSYFKWRKWMLRKKNCTLKVVATVVKILERKPQRGAGLLYKPIFQVSFPNCEVLVKSALYTHLFEFEVGQRIWIYVNPLNPQDFMYDSPYKDIVVAIDIEACVFPIVVILLFWIFF